VPSAKTKLAAASEVKGKLGILHRNGLFQLTLGGRPLYHFSGDDSKTGNANGQGLPQLRRKLARRRSLEPATNHNHNHANDHDHANNHDHDNNPVSAVLAPRANRSSRSARRDWEAGDAPRNRWRKGRVHAPAGLRARIEGGARAVAASRFALRSP
jgi:hypothetical protein